MSPKIQQILDTALEQVRAALLQEASEAVRRALARGGEVPTPFKGRRRKPGPKPKSATSSRRKGAKRTPEELDTLTKTLLAAIKRKPGQRIEEISREIGVSTKDLALPVAKLWDGKSIKTTGTRRATKYFSK